MTEVPIIKKPTHWFAEQINGLIFIDRELRHETVKASRFMSSFVFDNHWRHSDLFIVTLEKTWPIAVVFLLLTLNKLMLAGCIEFTVIIICNSLKWVSFNNYNGHKT